MKCWIFELYDRLSDKVIARYLSPDHPSYGNDGIIHPFEKDIEKDISYKVCVGIVDIKEENGSRLKVFERDYEYKESNKSEITIIKEKIRVGGKKFVDYVRDENIIECVYGRKEK